MEEFLEYIHGAHDPHASLEIVGSFDTGRYARRHVYRCCTNYNSFSNEWLVIFITQGPNGVDIEAFTPSCGGTTQYMPTVEAIARSVSITDS